MQDAFRGFVARISKCDLPSPLDVPWKPDMAGGISLW